MRSLAWTLLLAVVGAAQVPPEPAAAGQVVNSKTGEPLRKAFVSARAVGRPPVLEVTSVEGRFQFASLPPGDYELTVERSGYAPRHLRAALPNRKLRIALEPLAAIHGRITDEDGDPLPGVQVSVLRAETVYGSSLLARVKTVSAAPDGAYRADDLAPGRYYILAVSGAGNGSGETRRVVAPVFYPGVVSPALAAPVEAMAGVTLDGTDLRLPWKPAVTVRGRVEVPPGIKATLRLLPESGSFLMEWSAREVPLDGVGGFEIRNLAEGDYVLEADAGDDHGLQGRLPLAVTADTNGVRLRVERVPAVTLRVVSDDPACTSPSWILFPLQPGVLPVGVSSKAPARVPLGDYRPVAERAGRCYVRAMEYNGQAMLRQMTVAGDGVWQITLSPETGAMEGMLAGRHTPELGTALPAPGATAIVIPEGDDARLPLYHAIQADAQGRFEFPHLAPGIYRVLGRQDWREPNELTSLAALGEQGTRIRVEAGGQVQVIVPVD